MRWRRLFIPAAALALAACAASTSVDIITEERETEYAEISMQILQINIPGDKEFSESYNDERVNEAESAAAGFEAGTDSEAASGQKNVLTVTQDVKYNKNDFISAVEEQYTYTGGAHGMTMRKSHNIDTRLKCEVGLSDLFAEEGYEETLARMMRVLREENPEEYGELWAEPAIKKDQDFYITDTDLVIYYQPYELSYYARGFVEFPLRLSELRGYMKEDYYRLADTQQTPFS